jgi:LCP family protein required for cell wall assembly
MLISGLQILESTVFHQGTDPTIATKTIERDGVKYFPRQDITVVMLLGIDQTGKVEPSNSYNNYGASDVVSLLIFDETNQQTRILCLNRDTMLEMPILGIGGKKAGTAFQQLALSHTYGSGLEDSCANTRETVSNFLYGLQIDYYLSLNMDAIALLNDAVGGVTVTVTDDFSQIDPSIVKGEVTLTGQQAITFVRGRGGVGDQLNVSRMERQKEYMGGFMKAFKAKQDAGIEFLVSSYEEAMPYMVTDCSLTVLEDITRRYGDYPIVEIVSPEGENRKGETYMEYYVDEQKLDELILRLFYAPKKKG